MVVVSSASPKAETAGKGNVISAADAELLSIDGNNNQLIVEPRHAEQRVAREVKLSSCMRACQVRKHFKGMFDARGTQEVRIQESATYEHHHRGKA